MIIAEYIRTTTPQAQKGDGSTYYRCPMCRGNRKLEVSATGKIWYCHKCGKGGRCNGTRVKQIQQEEVPRRSYWRAKEDSRQWDYVEQRVGELVTELVPHHGPDSRRVYLPCYDPSYTGPVYMVGRATDGDTCPKYIYPRNGEFPLRKREAIWGLQRYHPETCGLGTVVICEGVLDAVVVPDAIALLGSTISDEQVQRISLLGCDEHVVLLDGDAYEKAVAVAIKLGRKCGNTFVARLPYGHDPGSCGTDQITKAMARKERVA